MNVKDTLKNCLLNYPLIFPNALTVYVHWFLINGNGYEWKDGELCSIYNEESTYNATNIEDAVINLITNQNTESFYNLNYNLAEKHRETALKLIKKHNEDIKDLIRSIFNWKERMIDFKVPKWFNNKTPKNDLNKFKFNDFTSYSKILNIPDDVKNDWLRAAKHFVDILEKNIDKIEDPNNIFHQIKERVNKLYNERYDKIIYLGEEYEFVCMETEEVGSGCHSWFEDVYKCRRIKDGYTRTFDFIEDMRLINIDKL